MNNSLESNSTVFDETITSKSSLRDATDSQLLVRSRSIRDITTVLKGHIRLEKMVSFNDSEVCDNIYFNTNGFQTLYKNYTKKGLGNRNIP